MQPLRRLASRDWLGAAEAGLYFSLSQLGFLLPPHILLGRWMARVLDEPAEPPSDVREARRLACITRAVSRRWPGDGRCLQRSLILCWLLRRRGLGGRLQIGVRRTPDGLVAHAWVTVAGAVVNDDEAHCAAFAVLERARARIATITRLEYLP